MRILGLIGVLMCLSSSAQARQRGGDGWLRIDGIETARSAVHFVLVFPERIGEKAVYRDAVVDLCHYDPRPICQIFYWDDGKLIPVSMPFTDAQADGVLAKYWRNDRTRLRALEAWRDGLGWE